MKPVETLKVMVKSRRNKRDRLAVLLQGVLGMSMRELRGMTLRGAVEQLLPLRKDDPTGLVNTLLGILRGLYQAGHAQDDILFPSTRHGGRLDRTGMFRILQEALRAAFGDAAKAPLRVLQALARAFQGLTPGWHVEVVSVEGRTPQDGVDRVGWLLGDFDPDPAPA